MTDNHLLIYRLAELMLDHQKHLLPVDMLFDDEHIGDFVKSIQIDSPYQQMLMEGVLSESVNDEKLYVGFTVEGYFHYVLGEVIFNQTKDQSAEVLKKIVEENQLKGAREGVGQCLIKDVQNDDLKRLILLIDHGSESLDLTIVPLANSFVNFYSESKSEIHRINSVIKRVRFILKQIYKSPTLNDDLVLFKCIEYLKSKYCSIQLNAIQESLDIIMHNSYSDEKILVLLKIFPWILDASKKEYYFNYIKNLSSKKQLSKYIKWEINSSLSVYFKKISDYSKAKYYHRKVVKYELESIGKISNEYAESIYFEGLLEIISGRYKAARKLFKNELKIREKISLNINNDVLITRCIHSIALTYQYEGSYKKAIKNYELALKRRLFEGGRYCESTVGTLSNFGIVLYESGISIDLAEEYLQDSIQINEMLKGKYCDNSTSIPFLARIKFDKGQLKEAEELLKINLVNRELNYGVNSRESAFSHADLMNFYNETNSFEKALLHGKIQNEILLLRLGNKHEFTISSFSELGEIYYKINKYISAIDNFKTALILTKKHYKNNLDFIVEMKYNIGICLLRLGNFRKAKLYFMQCLQKNRSGLLLNLIALCFKELNTSSSLKYHLMALEQYKLELPFYQIKEISVLDSTDNNSYYKIKNELLPNIKLKNIPNWLIKEYDS